MTRVRVTRDAPVIGTATRSVDFHPSCDKTSIGKRFQLETPKVFEYLTIFNSLAILLIKKVMYKRLLILVVYSCLSNLGFSQDISLRVRVSVNCYHVFKELDSPPPGKTLTVSVTQISTKQTVLGKEIANGEFQIDGLSEDNYDLVVGYGFPFSSDTLIQVGKSTSVVQFCLDSKFRPPLKSDITKYEQEAKDDVKNGQLKLYRLATDFPLTSKQLEKTRKSLQTKYGVEYVIEPHTNPFDRKEFELLSLCQAYNKIVEKSLDDRYGQAWREVFKFQ